MRRASLRQPRGTITRVVSAVERKGVEYTAEALATELLKDKAYFDKSGGGVTASGGEPLLQAQFVRALFGTLRSEGVQELWEHQAATAQALHEGRHTIVATGTGVKRMLWVRK